MKVIPYGRGQSHASRRDSWKADDHRFVGRDSLPLRQRTLPLVVRDGDATRIMVRHDAVSHSVAIKRPLALFVPWGPINPPIDV